MTTKLQPRKAYGNIPHLPGSKRGPADRGLEAAQAKLVTEKVRDKHDRVFVQEKLDGTCVAVEKHEDEIVPLIRAGYRAVQSRRIMHVYFHDWVMERWQLFDSLLEDGERVVGEWLAQAHGTLYSLVDKDPFVPFDIMRNGHERATHEEFSERIDDVGLSTPMLLSSEPIAIEAVLDMLNERDPDKTYGYHGALDPVEGAVWRLERRGKVDFICKYVRHDYVPGRYFTDSDGNDIEVWNWRPNI